MHSTEWREILSRLPDPLRRLRAPARSGRLRRLEARLGADLPEPYRSFLQCADGGWLGDLRIYGTPELEALLQPGTACAGFRIRAFEPVGANGWHEPRRHLLPFHPVDRFGVECIDLDRPAAPVVWCTIRNRSVDAVGVGGHEPWDERSPAALHPLAAAVLWWTGAPRPVMVDTYVDFLDWALDSILDAHMLPAGG